MHKAELSPIRPFMPQDPPVPPLCKEKVEAVTCSQKFLSGGSLCHLSAPP